MSAGTIEEIPLAGLALASLLDDARPRVLRGLCHDWPLVALARRSDTEFARALAAHDNGTPVDALLLAPEEGGRIGYNADASGFNYRHFRVPLTRVLERLAAFSRMEHAPGVALQSAPMSACVPGLVQAHRLALLGAETEPRLWLGNRVTTPAHFDSSHNIAVVACGRRRFTLFPPDQIGNLYIGPPDFAPTAAAISLARLDAPDFARFPRLEQALAHALVAELVPGDAIYIPPVWWHHVESLETLNALVNFWWRKPLFTGHVPEPPLNALMHCILALKPMPAAERAAWRTVLEHYVFNDQDPAAHMPRERRGVLGALTPEVVATLEQLLGRKSS